MDLLDGNLLAIAGNHDCGENALSRDDTMSILLAAGKLRLIGEDSLWLGQLNGVAVVVGGTSWGRKLPKEIDRTSMDCPGVPRWVFWLTHHDVRFPGYEEAGHVHCRDIPGIDLVINGHIHRQLEDVTVGTTLWCNPGNIARVNRSDATRAHEPAVLRIDVSDGEFVRRRIIVPHEPAGAVFHQEMVQAAGAAQSAFIDGLAGLERYKTDDGQGLREFLDQQLPKFDPAIAGHIRRLAAEVIAGGSQP
jgi:predicted phosphodiesterase